MYGFTKYYKTNTKVYYDLGRSTLPNGLVHMCSSTRRSFLYLLDLCLPFIYNIKILNELLNSVSAILIK